MPNVTFSAGVRRLEGIDDQAFVASFSVPLGTRNRAIPEIQATRAEREQLRLTASARRLELHSLLFSLYQEVLHARTEATALHVEIRPQAERMVETTAEGYRLGRYSLVELIDAQRALIEIEQDSIRAAVEFHTNLIEIERATGVGVQTLAPR
jgi:cobalt-zinc-cadmium efflux system outer membrane protein